MGRWRAIYEQAPARPIAHRGLTQAAAADVLEVDQPKVSALIRGRLGRG